MILLDTPVVIGALSPSPDPLLIDWLNSHPIETLFISASSLTALISVVVSASSSSKKQAEDTTYSRIVSMFESRIIPLDLAATKKLHAFTRTLTDLNINVPNLTLQNASIAASRDYQLASLDVEPLSSLDVELIDLGATNLMESA